jgi:hypothetical protein
MSLDKVLVCLCHILKYQEIERDREGRKGERGEREREIVQSGELKERGERE